MMSVRRNNWNEKFACFENNCFEVELAITPEERNRGLMFRESLERNKGMLFIFEKEGEYPFWMRNTLIPLDMIWISEEGEVVFIEENAEPCSDSFCPGINPEKNAKYVLEINGGISNNIGLEVGDNITLNID
jgi:uncharacterized membrane protein (UPF0127 family)